ncbi:MAG: head GIN domain-containing protein [Sphingomonadaceae bacterium]
MRPLILFPPLLFVTACSASADNADTPSGASGARDFAAAGFDAVSLRGPDNVVVKVGGAASVRAVGDQKILDKLEIEVVDGTLRVGRKKKDRMMHWGREDKDSVTVTVTLPALKAASVAGSGNLGVDTISGKSFDGAIAGSGNLSIAVLAVDKADLSIAGSGNARIAGGNANALDVSIAGSGDLDAAALAARTADISIAGSGGVRAGVSDSADISILGSGGVDIIGNAKCAISKMGSGDVRCTPTATAAPE